MGVQGLTTLLKDHQEVYREVHFSRSRLLIDGSNLIYLLYFNSGLDQNHGGEYAAFELLIEKFFSALRECSITPYVVLDGGSDPSDKKLETVVQRAKDRIKKADRAAEGGRQQGILPLLGKLVFRQTLARLKVQLAKCYGEADQEIAALASEWQCPVLSRDSDFYIFELPAGLLPITDFRWEDVQRSGSQSFILCKSYNTSSFCIVFDIQRHLLPTFAALAGNDYVKLCRMESPIRWDQFAPEGCGGTSKLEGLLHWLKDFHQPQEAFEAALGLMGELSEQRKEEVLKGLYLGMEEYQLPPSSLKKFFIHGTPPPFPGKEEVAGLVPDWTRLLLTQARVTSDVLDVLLMQRLLFSSPVDLAAMPSVHLTARPLRQLMYGLLLGEGKEVKEGDRVGLELKFTSVKPVITALTRQLTLHSLDKVESSLRLQVLLEALGVTEDSLSVLPPQLRLPVAVTCYWLQSAEPRPDPCVLNALLLGLSTGDTLGHRAALQIESHRGEKLDVVAAHAFNKWQTCMKASVQLNQLLSFPLPEPQISRLFEGTLVHQLFHRIRTGGKPKLFPKNDRASVKLYNTMQAVVHRSMRSDTRQRASAPQQPPLGDLTSNLRNLLYEDDEEAAAEARSMVRVEEDLLLSSLKSVKTRYRAKNRQNRCKNLELSRKCRGRDLL